MPFYCFRSGNNVLSGARHRSVELAKTLISFGVFVAFLTDFSLFTLPSVAVGRVDSGWSPGFGESVIQSKSPVQPVSWRVMRNVNVSAILPTR